MSHVETKVPYFLLVSGNEDGMGHDVVKARRSVAIQVAVSNSVRYFVVAWDVLEDFSTKNDHERADAELEGGISSDAFLTEAQHWVYEHGVGMESVVLLVNWPSGRLLRLPENHLLC